MSSRDIVFSAAGAGGDVNYIDDVFSTYLYTGNSSTQTITNGIDLAGEGGLVWIKARSNVSSNTLYDTARGNTKSLYSNTTNNESTAPAGTDLSGFNSNGFSLGPDFLFTVNYDTYTYASWTFRKAPKFFDVVTWSGTGSGMTINHNLGSAPGMIIMKKLSGPSGTGNWGVWHRGLPASSPSPQYSSNVFLNLTDQSDAYEYLSAAPTSTNFSVNNSFAQSSVTYVAYLFAHNAGGFGAAGTDNVISCGSYTGNGSTTGPVVTLGYEPQWIMYKQVSSAGNNWFMVDNMRGLPVGGTTSYLLPNSSAAEGSGLGTILDITATGFQLKTTAGSANGSGETYIYMAIRRPMKPPTSGTQVFMPVARTGNATSNTPVTAGFTVDMFWNGIRNFAGEFPTYFDRLRGNDRILFSNATAAEFSTASVEVAFNRSNANTGVQIGVNNNGINGNGVLYVDHFFRRAPGFFDEVCWTGNSSSNQTVNHNLTVAPELIITKSRGNATAWLTYAATEGVNKYALLNSSAGFGTITNFWPAAPTSTTFNIDMTQYGAAQASAMVAYLFATVAGVSKVGSYSGTGATQTINCGFTGGARFVLIKRSSDSGGWYVWDTARGMVAGTDPFLALNTTDAETNLNTVYTITTGFQIVGTDPELNASGSTYIYLAIA